MSLESDLIETYDTVSGHEPEGVDKIAPVAHHYFSIRQAIDITINQNGEFIDAEVNAKLTGKTLLAVTEESASRTSSAAAVTPHALNDNLMFMTSQHGTGTNSENKSYDAFMSQLSGWAEKEDTPVSVKAVYRYLKHHDPIDDMLERGKLPAEKDGQIDISKYMKYTVRWKVISSSDDAIEQTWLDPAVLQSWTEYYLKCRETTGLNDLDAMTGAYCDVERVHPKPISAYGNSKLISTATKEDSTLHYKGERFNQADQILQVSYLSSQKMHNALSWLVSTQGISISKSSLPSATSNDKPKFIVCWEPHFEPSRYEEDNLLKEMFLDTFDWGIADDVKDNKVSYQSLRDVFKKKLYMQSDDPISQHKVSIFMIDRSGDGRLSPVLYRSFTVEDFFHRIDHWQSECCWFVYDKHAKKTVIQSISLFNIARCAFGVERENEKGIPYLDVNEDVFKDTISVLLRSVLDSRTLPISFIQRIASQASSPERFAGNKAYKWKNWNLILRTACALIHQSHMETNSRKGEKDLELDRDNTDRSYLFGRLLAVADRVENYALYKKNKTKVSDDGEEKGTQRDTNAMRLWSAYAAHPYTCFVNLRKCIAPYLSSLPYKSRKFYEDEMQEIITKLDMHDRRLNHPLEPEYLIGFYQERASLFNKQDKAQEQETVTETEEVTTNGTQQEN